MSRIRVLSDRVANQIAAGEVVERPAAAVKELVENALDAGATRVEVEFRHGGQALIRVEDNGQGMDREDAQLAFERHATSKLAEAADLDRLASFGFRGEALPSIASISRCRLQTRPEGAEAGTEILIDAGRRVHVRDCGRPVGTRIEVEHLFHPVPARRKFLKSERTEAAHIVQCVRLYALACPGVAFTLIEDGRTIFRSPECAALAERVGEILGRELAEGLLPLEAAEPGLRLHGLIGRPGAGRPTRLETIAFVNGRPVDSRTIHYALLESYRGALPEARYPPAVLFLECDPAAVDVNVHPAKREVRFRQEATVRSFLVRSLLGRLREIGAPVQAPGAAPALLREDPPPGFAPGPLAVYAAPAPDFASASSPPAAAPAGPPPGWRYLGTAHQAYALFETPAGLILLDRRAAEERIWFERLQAPRGDDPVPSQRLLLPLTLEFDPVSAALLQERGPFLRDLGFGLEEFGRHCFRLEGIPEWMDPGQGEPFLREVIGALREGRIAAEDGAAAREQFARLAAGRAAGTRAALEEGDMLALAGRLFATRSPHVSPSGRATCVELGHGELARRFGR
ncbi:MAG TPA: DNA mismatch repair endonuclease MutL [Opitutaceae bacterium]|nr:DNA mismatch repair endonuclease MutL [Opitutaceae bacterium]